MSERPHPRPPLPRAVLLLGLVSFFTDVASDLAMPLLPLLLATMTASPGTMLGLIEGCAEATASFLKLGAGWLSDRTRRKKPLVVVGYGVASVIRPLLGLAGSPFQVLAIRVTDRVGKGIRSAPRDAMIAGAVPPSEAGRAFGVHRAMDHAGAVVGPALAALLLALGLELRQVLLVAAIPGLFAMIALAFVREPEVAEAEAPKDNTRGPVASPSLRRYLFILALFALGNPSDTFLVLRAQSVGITDATIPILWGALHVSKMLATYVGGGLADRLPRRRLIAIGWTINAAAFGVLGLATEPWHVWVVLLGYGAYHGLTEPAERALVKDLAPEHARGRAYGLYHFVVGITAIPAGLGMGALWDHAGPELAFATGAALAALAALALAIESRRAR